MQSSDFTTEKSALQKGEDFVRAFMLGFEVADAVALLRMDDLYIGENGCPVYVEPCNHSTFCPHRVV
jgi:hypothetical protein